MTPERWRRIDELLQSALARPAAERAAYLARACAGDEPLHREVASLAAAHEAGTLLDRPLSEVAADVLFADGDDSMVGRSIGPYRLLVRLGGGGMGEVYRARDARIGRDVAVKVLPPLYAADPERLRRFEQEARAAGALNHPNVLTLHDLGRDGDTPYLVSELLEGETLRVRLDGGALPWRPAVEIAAAVADGLAATHAKGIVHRDLKPENLFLTGDGRVKILDFGLAKLWTQDGQPAGGAETRPGQVMGTAGYMSPEQVAGGTVDGRSDLFALGCVLYEMVSGRRAFQRPTAAETMAAIVTEEPAPLAAPAGLQRLVAHCLEKDAEARFQSARDLAFGLRGLLDAGASVTTPVAGRRLARRWPAWLLAGAALLAAATAAARVSLRRPPVKPDALRFAIPVPQELTPGVTLGVSPDGRRVIINVADASGARFLWLRPLDAPSGYLLPVAGGPFVAWSADARFVFFLREEKLHRYELGGSRLPEPVCAWAGFWGADVSGAGDVLLGTEGGGLQRVSAAGGTPAPVTTLDPSRQEVSHSWPSFLPDGRHFLYFARSSDPSQNAVYVGSLDGTTRRRLFASESRAAYAGGPDGGHLVHAREGTLVAQAFDPATLELSGRPLRVAERVAQTRYGNAVFALSRSGVLVYRSDAEAHRQLVWFDRRGRRIATPGPPGPYANLTLSPDDGRVALDRTDGTNQDVWTMDLATGHLTRLTFDPQVDHFPVWSPDGTRIAFDSHRSGAGDLYVKPASGAAAEELLLKSLGSSGVHDWSRDARYLAFSGARRGDVWILPLDGERKPFPFLNGAASEHSARFSPDGRWIAYVSDESRRSEVYVRPFDGAGAAANAPRWQVSSNGGAQPLWRRDGRELFYLTPDDQLVAVPVKGGGTFQAGPEVPLFRVGPGFRRGTRNDYDVAGDGQRFLFGMRAPEGTSAINVIVNWPSAAAE
jgi:eukaryotic-like serine/threonine-protein kinase